MRVGRKKTYAHFPEQGFAMLEVLITIVVISFGLLGLAGLQAVGLKNNQTAYLRSIATQQAYDMADRMRANFTGVQAGDYNNISGVGANQACSSACTPAQLAAYDRFSWNTANAALLPGGSGTVLGSPATVFNVTVSWTEKCTTGEAGCAGDGTVARNFVTRFMP